MADPEDAEPNELAALIPDALLFDPASEPPRSVADDSVTLATLPAVALASAGHS